MLGHAEERTLDAQARQRHSERELSLVEFSQIETSVLAEQQEQGHEHEHEHEHEPREPLHITQRLQLFSVAQEAQRNVALLSPDSAATGAMMQRRKSTGEYTSGRRLLSEHRFASADSFNLGSCSQAHVIDLCENSYSFWQAIILDCPGNAS